MFESSKLINEHLKNAAASGEGLSLRQWSILFGMSPTYLNLILKSERLISERALLKVVKGLDLDDISKNNLIEVRNFDWLKLKKINLKTTTDQNKTNKVKYAKEILDDSILFKSWLHFAILDFSTCDNFTEDVQILSQYFNSPPHFVKHAIMDLETSGYLVRDQNGKLSKKNQHMRVPVPRSSKAIRDFHVLMLKKATQTLSQQPKSEEVVNRYVSSFTLAVNDNHLPLAREMLNEAVHKIVEQLGSGNCSNVYQFQIQLLPLMTS